MKYNNMLIFIVALFLISPVTMAERYYGAAFGFTEVVEISSEESVTIKLYAGSKGKFLGYEAAYLDFDDFSAFGNGVSGRAAELSAAVYLPLKPGISIIARIGVLPYYLSGNSAGSAIDTGRGVSASYGGGIQFDIFKRVSIRFQFQKLDDVGNVEMSFLSFGTGIRF